MEAPWQPLVGTSAARRQFRPGATAPLGRAGRRRLARRPGGERALTPGASPDPGATPPPRDEAGPDLLGLYLHVPFCAALCRYCTFTRRLSDPALERRYVASLGREIRAAGRAAPGGATGTRADTIYVGGGTPSLLAPADVGGLVAACREAFDLDGAAEITLEANPETVTPASLAGYREAGVTRLSLGVQSFSDRELRRLGRIHDAARAVAAYREARRAGFDNISLDLMLWLPGQSRADLAESVGTLAALAPEHASVYLLEIYPGSPLDAEMAREGWTRVSDDEAADMYLETMERLEASGLAQYEISNLARPGRRSRHNLKYWTDGAWIGFGCGAHSTVRDQRWENVALVPEYLERVEAGVAPVAAHRRLSARERLEDALVMGLRLTDGIAFDRFRRDYGVDVATRWAPAIATFEEAGLVERDARGMRLTRRGLLVANDVMIAFIEGGSTVK